MAGALRMSRWLLPLLAFIRLMVASRLALPAPNAANGKSVHLGQRLSGGGGRGPFLCGRAAHRSGLEPRGGGRAGNDGGAGGMDGVGAFCEGISSWEGKPLRLRGGGRGKKTEDRMEDFPLPPSLRRGRMPKDSGSRSSSLDVPDDVDDSTSLGTSSSSDDGSSKRPASTKPGKIRDSTKSSGRSSSASEERGPRGEEEEEVQQASPTSKHKAPAAAAAVPAAESAAPSKSELLKSAAEKFVQTPIKEDGRRNSVAADGEVVLRFDDSLVGRGLEVNTEGVTLTKWQETWVPGADVGYNGEAAWQDLEETIPFLHPVPTFCLFGPEGTGGVYVYHLLIEKCFNGNMFIGCLEPPFDWKKPNFGYYIKERGWMVTDGGSFFRTGPDVGGPGFCDDPEQPGKELKAIARECGAEMLTAQLKKDLYPHYPEVTTPGIWCFQDGSVITLTLHRDEGTVTFEIDDRPPVTLKNVSANARPFINMLYQNDTVSLLSPAAADFARHKWRMKQRSPADPDYWLWDKERWTLKDGGLYYKDGELCQDTTKKNIWFPKIDAKDARSPVPGLSLLEYNFRRDTMQEEKAAKRRRERERLARRADEKGEERHDWRKGREQQKMPLRDDVDDSDVQFAANEADSDDDGVDDPVARFKGRDQAPDSSNDETSSE